MTTSPNPTAGLPADAPANQHGVEVLLSRYETHLAGRGHARRTIELYTKVVAHFLRWLAERDVSVKALDSAHVSAFQRHLIECRCARPGPRYRPTARAAVHQLFAMLGHDTRPERWSPGVTAVVSDFDNHMRSVAGLAEATRVYRCRWAGDFLTYHFGTRAVAFERLRPSDVRTFVALRAPTLESSSLGPLLTALRGLLRYAQFRGLCRPALAAAVPRSASGWQTKPPRALGQPLIERFLAGFDREVSTGRRDYAIARCLVDLGMRASEVARLRLLDVDWRSGTIQIPAVKGLCVNTLPLAPETGHAIAAYLCDGRPATASRALFVHHRSRSGEPIVTSTVRGAMRRGFARAGMPTTLAQVHRLRHSIATRLLASGASFKAIADVLGHASFDTTGRYLSVDAQRLRAVAMPWPGGEG